MEGEASKAGFSKPGEAGFACSMPAGEKCLCTRVLLRSPGPTGSPAPPGSAKPADPAKFFIIVEREAPVGDLGTTASRGFRVYGKGF